MLGAIGREPLSVFFSYDKIDLSSARRNSLPVAFSPNPHRRWLPLDSTCFCSRENDVVAGVEHPISRNHNCKSTALLLHGLSHCPSPVHNKKEGESLPQIIPQHDDKFKANENEELLEVSSSRLLLSKKSSKRIPFPGSVIDAGTNSSQFDLSSYSQNEEMEDLRLRRAVDLRRTVVAGILRELMRGGATKFSKTYADNLVSRLPDFIDRVVVAAAFMKQQQDFSHSTFEVRVRAYVNSSKLIPLIRWLKHNSLTYPQIGKLICMTSSGDMDSTLRGLVHWLKTIHVKGNFLGYVLTRADNILQHSPTDLEEIAHFLEIHGIRRDWMGFIVSRCPELLSFTMQEMESRVNFYLNMGMSDRDFGTMVFDCPKALGSFSIEQMNAKVEYLREFGLNNEEVGKLLAFKPQLIGCSIEERWKPLVKFLYYLGIRRDGIKRMLMMKPTIFCVDLKTTIVPKVQFLQDIGIQEEAIGSLLVKFPPFLTYSLYKKIRTVVIFLMTKAGVSHKDIGKVIALEPALVGCSIKKLEVNVKYFLSLGIPLQSLGEMIADFPMLLKYNIDILRPKYRYLRRTMVRPLQELIEFPRFFSYSLEARIIPRHKILVKNQINFKLRYMLAASDEKFDEQVNAAVHRRWMFRNGDNYIDG
ncbi:transcription termination factor MTERF2, chloroplastic [Aristolochia californica]|uniref:transcription termination factor MTERF2, chloroplastic n=1 Tax=Aristolochia californica TaxID=171875 RepID=UPI0035DBEE81